MPASRPPTVLQVLPALVTGGVERGTVEITHALVRAGWRAVVASSGGPMAHEVERAGGVHVTLPLRSKNPFTMRRNVGRLRQVIEDYEVDIVHARSRAPAWSAWAAARRSRRFFVTTFHNIYGGQTVWKRFYNSVMSKGARVIAISRFVAEHAHRVYGVGRDRLRIIHRGVDLVRFDPEAIHPSRLIALAKEWRLVDGAGVIMLPARVTRWKGHMELLDAVARLKRRDVQVLFVGNEQQRPDYRRELERRVSILGLDGLVHMVGNCRDMPAAYMLADVVVQPSTEPEGFGRTAVEAQAMGRPMIATDHGGARETVFPGETGWLVPPGDVQALAQALSEALSLDAAARIELAHHSRAIMIARFDSQLMCDATLAVYSELLFPDQVNTLPIDGTDSMPPAGAEG
ncbi:MAG TPA: glycosyltransferase family 4 protein [Stellaceae bacterium]|nr:glycosyltransferase family 4 protein [Stellaceae bacterium]